METIDSLLGTGPDANVTSAQDLVSIVTTLLPQTDNSSADQDVMTRKLFQWSYLTAVSTASRT